MPSQSTLASIQLRPSLLKQLWTYWKKILHILGTLTVSDTLVSDNAQAFLSEDFQTFLSERGIIHLTGAPYHPATNGQAERFIQTFKNSMNKSKLPPNQALQEFLIQYRRTPLESGLSPSELLNGRQIRGRIDTLYPSRGQC